MLRILLLTATVLSRFLRCAALADTAVALDHLGQNASLFQSALGSRVAVSNKHRRNRRHISKSRVALSSLAEVQASKLGTDFPEYQRKGAYVHPLDAAGQILEKQAVAGLNANSVMDYLKALVAFPTRSFSNVEESHKVEDFLKHTFQKMGYVSCLHNFNDEDAQGPLTNVIAYIPGTTDATVTVGAHYDSRPFDGRAPGAEDNGSGVAAMLAIAKAFSDAKISPKASVYFVAFAGEEPGLIGSRHFVEALQSSSASIPDECRPRGSFLLRKDSSASGSSAALHKAIVLDEVGWASPKYTKPTVNLESFDWTANVMDQLLESSQTHNGDALRVVHNPAPFGSDHMSFLDHGLMAVLTINGDDEAYPNYHQSTDTIENVSPKLVSMISKMNLGALIRMAGVRQVKL